jgi:hypothetical protein
MRAALAHRGIRPASLEIFRVRCNARASLVRACDLILQTAVDELQDSAIASGLVAELGQDGVQAVMAEAFAGIKSMPKAEVASSATVDDSEREPTSVPTIPSSTLAAAKHLIKQNDAEGLRIWLAKHTPAERIALLNLLRGAKDGQR